MIRTRKLVIIITSCERKHSSRRGRHCTLSETLFLVFREAQLCFSAGLKHYIASVHSVAVQVLAPLYSFCRKELKYLNICPKSHSYCNPYLKPEFKTWLTYSSTTGLYKYTEEELSLLCPK